MSERADTEIDPAEVQRDVESCRASHTALVADLTGRDPVDPGSASRLPGWTVGHVLTHIARHADGFLAILDGRPQYSNGREGRDADIEAGAGRPWDVLVADVVATCDALGARFAGLDDWHGTVTMMMGERPLRMLPLLRQREVEVHRSDLGLGHEFDAMPSDYVRRDLVMMEMLWKARQPMGATALPAAALAEPPARRLAWLMGRSPIEGLDPAAIF